MSGLAGLLSPEGMLRLLVSSTDRDRGAGVPPIQAPALRGLAGAWEPYGLAVTEVRPATPADVAAAHSSWGKRLGAGRQRPAWLLRAGKAGGDDRARRADRAQLGMDRR